MGSSIAADDITLSEDSPDSGEDVNSFAKAIETLGNELLKSHEEKTGNLSANNILGMVQCQTLNDWKEKNYGYRHSVLDKICEINPNLKMSHNGFGITKLIEGLKGIQVSFEQSDLSKKLRDKLM